MTRQSGHCIDLLHESCNCHDDHADEVLDETRAERDADLAWNGDLTFDNESETA